MFIIVDVRPDKEYIIGFKYRPLIFSSSLKASIMILNIEEQNSSTLNQRVLLQVISSLTKPSTSSLPLINDS